MRSSLISAVLAGLFLLSTTVCAGKKLTQTIHIEITSHLGDQQVFQQNDIISFLLSLDKAAYVYVIYQDASRQLTQIVPNKLQPVNFYRAGVFIAVPAENSAFQFIIQPPFGKETLWVFATDNASLVFPGKNRPNGLKLLKADINSIRTQVQQHSKERWGEAHFDLTSQEGR
ncbi:hypothetical protein MNBD_GAMMA11-3435 [hydrothermal vent metagenome]|uniref:DUF4384 domain-containing protein n=1 Tax=hydrothermal vent metagenome TaxID=652676 RepID=A0A3B0WV56_9ZZZZ